MLPFIVFLLCLHSVHAVTPARKSLFVQGYSWYLVGDALLLDTYLRQVCANHRDPRKPGYIENIVLQVRFDSRSTTQDVAGGDEFNYTDPLHKDLIDVMLAYFPGGDGPCQFDNAFVGTVDLQVSSTVLFLHMQGRGFKLVDTKFESYREGMIIDCYRNMILDRSFKVAMKFDDYVKHSRNPKVVFHWYISQEMIFNYLTNNYVVDGTIAYYTQHIKDLSAIHQPRAILWSPFFVGARIYTSQADQDLIAVGVKKIFKAMSDTAKSVNSYGASEGGPLWIALQDTVGAGYLYYDQATDWVLWLKNVSQDYNRLQMNVEQYWTMQNGTGTVGNDTYVKELIARENYYLQNGITLGACWEIRFWIKYQ